MSKSYGAVAASVAANKAKHPDKYCSHPRCLWRLTSGACPKHMRDRSNGEAVEERTMTVPPSSPLAIVAESSEITVSRNEELTYDEVSHGSGDYDAFNMPLDSRKPEKGSDEWYEMMDNPKSAWRAGE